MSIANKCRSARQGIVCEAVAWWLRSAQPSPGTRSRRVDNEARLESAVVIITFKH